MNMAQRSLHTSTEQFHSGKQQQLSNQQQQAPTNNRSKATDDSNCYKPMPVRAAVATNP